jgi:hypothetical protein
MDAPLPRLLDNLIQNGYVAASGNRAQFLAATKPGVDHRVSIVTNWKRKPSAEDRAEVERMLSSVYNVRVNPNDCDPTKKGRTERLGQLADEMKEFLEGKL